MDSVFHVSNDGLAPGTHLRPDYTQWRRKVSIFYRACCQGPAVFAATLIAGQYTDEILTPGTSMAAKWAAEGLFEWVRLNRGYDRRPGRCESLFAFENHSLAAAFIEKHRSSLGQKIYECAPLDIKTAYRTDMLFFDEANEILRLSAVSGSKPIAKQFRDLQKLAIKYWDSPRNPRWPEILLPGGATVIRQLN